MKELLLWAAAVAVVLGFTAAVPVLHEELAGLGVACFATYAIWRKR